MSNELTGIQEALHFEAGDHLEEVAVPEYIRTIAGLCSGLGAASVGGPLSAAERYLLETAGSPPRDLDHVRAAIAEGRDPLGEAIDRGRHTAARRDLGAFYTPPVIVGPMIAWALARSPSRLVDAGCGSGRFCVEAVRRAPGLEIVAVDVDPIATLACRAAMATVRAKCARVINADYTTLPLEPVHGRTAFVGNPPYVRHHRLSPDQKSWAKSAAAKLAVKLSGLAGLHVHFLLNNKLSAFDDVMTTAVISCFEVGAAAREVRIRNAGSAEVLGHLEATGGVLGRSVLERTRRWSPLFNGGGSKAGTDTVPLGEIVRVSRGVATGANRFFVMDRRQVDDLGLGRYVVPVLSSAKEVLSADGMVRLHATRRWLLDPPMAVELEAPEHEPLRSYLKHGEQAGVPSKYLCAHRRPWWHIGSKVPPIVATYMARQPPAFALNPDGLTTLNVVHGLFPRINLDQMQLLGLVRYLNGHRSALAGHGRTYQGGLEKFEPSEMEALEVPPPEQLRAYGPS